MLQDFVHFIVFSVHGMAPGSRTSDALKFFIYDVIKIFLLLSVIIFAVSIIRSYFPPERTKRILSHKRKFIGNIIAVLLGIVTPFCSCSAVPLLAVFVSIMTVMIIGVGYLFNSIL